MKIKKDNCIWLRGAFFCITVVSIILITVCILFGNVSTTQSLVLKGDFVVHTVNVGQGDAVVIVLPTNETVLIDSGSKSNVDVLLGYIDGINVGGKKLKAFDYAILTHPDEDHCGGMYSVLQQYRVKSFYRPNVKAYDPSNSQYFDPAIDILADNVHKTDTAAYRQAIDSIYKFSDKVFINEATQFFINGHTNISENRWSIDIYPYGTREIAGTVDNNYSPVIVVNCRQKRFVFCGDAEQKVLDKFMNVQSDYGVSSLNANVIMLSHHGSNSNGANSLKFLEFAFGEQRYKDGVVLISVGKNNYSQPSIDVLNRLKDIGINDKNIYRTDYDGTIGVMVAKDGHMSVEGIGQIISDDYNIQIVCGVILAVLLTMSLVLLLVYVKVEFAKISEIKYKIY